MIAALALTLGAAGCGGPSSRTGPTRVWPAPVAPAAYAHYLRGRLAFYDGDYAAATRELRRARRAAPGDPDVARALAEAALLYLSAD